MIKESMEVLVAVEAECDAVIAACADGKISLGDIRYEMPVLAKARDAFLGVDKVPAEIQGATVAEIEALLLKVYAVGGKLVDAMSALSAVFNKPA